MCLRCGGTQSFPAAGIKENKTAKQSLRIGSNPIRHIKCAPLAQPGRATGNSSEGRKFKSFRAHQSWVRDETGIIKDF